MAAVEAWPTVGKGDSAVPAPGTAEVLSTWITRHGVPVFGLIATSAIAQPSQPDKVIYGDDDRIDVYQENDAVRLGMAAATCGLFDSGDVTDNQDGTFTLDTFNYTVSGAPPCNGEAFANQPVSAFCSGFLAGDDIVVTAGHCLETEGELSSIRFIFGFQMSDADTAVTEFDENRVYTLVNYLIQGGAAEIFKSNLVKLDQADLTEMLIVPVHDEIVLQAPREDAEEIKRLVKQCMTTTEGWAVPLTADVDGPLETWGDKY